MRAEGRRRNILRFESGIDEKRSEPRTDIVNFKGIGWALEDRRERSG